MQVSGKIKALHGIKKISDKFKVCDLWLDTLDEYPQELSIQLTNERAMKAHSDLKEGDEITLDINIKGREYDKKDGSGKGRFTSVEAWKWTKVGESNEDTSAPIYNEEDDLPFN